jgi:hypothetical protein
MLFDPDALELISQHRRADLLREAESDRLAAQATAQRTRVEGNESSAVRTRGPGRVALGSGPQATTA